MALNPFRAALPLRDNGVFLEELLGCLGESLARLEDAGARLSTHFKEPVLSELLRLGEVVLLKFGCGG